MSEAQERDEARSGSSSAVGDPPDEIADRGMQDLQLVELSILHEFVRLCDTHGLRYYLAYGTLLGAVRHHGFIPWDDDVDVTMPREDYNRFAEICRSGDLRHGFRWQSYATETRYPHWFGKLIKTDTVLRQAPSQHLLYEQSVYIDVFPLDGLANKSWEAFAQRVLLGICRLRLSVNLKRTPLKRVAAQLTRVLPRRSVISVIGAINRRYPAGRASKWICVGGPYGHRRQSFPSRWFGLGQARVFEDLTVTGPVEWDRYLAQLYGEYMIPPPPGDRVSHHEVRELRI